MPAPSVAILLILAAMPAGLACGTGSTPSNGRTLDAASDSAVSRDDTGADSAADGGDTDATLDAMPGSGAPDGSSGGGLPDGGVGATSPEGGGASGHCGLTFVWRTTDAGKETQVSCQSSIDGNCCPQERACAEDSSCRQMVACINACPRPASQCISACFSAASNLAMNEFAAFASCGKDGGAPGCDWP